ncbi:MAG TPA: nitrate/nitrite transporter NrtS [Candidatus Dormibacteraeota bacterium]|nr:nitrate/nitrite transporter NrtS [Candidatus Dormibacteraeota bacterium]
MGRPVIFRANNLRRTVAVALLVGTVLVAINQLDIVIAGRATPGTWLKIALTYLVPFCVANYGLLVGARGEAAT